MKKTTLDFLEKNNACHDGIEYYKTLKTTKTADILKKCAEDKEFSHAMWLIIKTLKHKELIQFSVFCAEQVIDIYEKENPKDKRPRLAIDAANAVIKRNTKQNRAAAGAAAGAAADAAAYAAARAADAAAGAAAYAAAYAAAGAAARAAGAAAGAADAAAYAAARAADAEIRKICIDYAAQLIEERK